VAGKLPPPSKTDQFELTNAVLQAQKSLPHYILNTGRRWLFKLTSNWDTSILVVIAFKAGYSIATFAGVFTAEPVIGRRRRSILDLVFLGRDWHTADITECQNIGNI
jgi:hypothetical protein